MEWSFLSFPIVSPVKSHFIVWCVVSHRHLVKQREMPGNNKIWLLLCPKFYFFRVLPGWMSPFETMCVFSGMNCELALPCLSNPCYGESVCLADEQNGGLTYKCICDEIHSGKYCEKTPCYPNPCNFNGKCTLSLADPGGGGGARDTPQLGPISFTFMQFFPNNRFWPHLRDWCSPIWEILDLPLVIVVAFQYSCQ